MSSRTGSEPGAADSPLDCVIVGAGPGGLQAAIYLGRYRRKVLVLDRGGGRTLHARSIENFLGRKAVSGKELIELGMEQARSFGVEIERAEVLSIARKDFFEVRTRTASRRSKFVIVATGVSDVIPSLRNLRRFFGTSFFTCIDCDGYRTTGRNLAIIGNGLECLKLAFAARELYTPQVTLILASSRIPAGYDEELKERNIRLISGEPAALIGEDRIEGIELTDGTRVPCEAVLSHFGVTLNDGFLEGLNLERDPHTRSFVVNRRYQSTLPGLYIVGPLNTGNDQVVIAAGEGAVAAIDINQRLLES